MSDTLQALTTATTGGDVEDLLENEELVWKPLGDRENNVGTVRSGSDPGQALAERITNGIDAVIERGVHENHIGNEPESPREAVEDLFGLSKGGFNAMSNEWVRETAENNLRVSMAEGADKNTPTIEVRDEGIGQRPENFPNTFLGLNEDSKITKPYLIGKYGQGGSNTFDFCEYAIVLSRHVDGGNLGWSIVRFNPRLDEEEMYSDGVFEYCVRPDGTIPQINEHLVEDWKGSLVRLVEYEAADFNHSLTPSRGSLYTVAHEVMFGSLFPFILEDTRSTRFESYDGARRRTVVGSRYRLDKPAGDVYDAREFRRVDLGDLGSIRVKYWVLEDVDSVSQFVEKTEPVVFTLHGQKHHAESKQFLKQTGYTFLKDRLIVEVNCDDLSQEGKRVFSSTRDRASEGREYRTIINRLSETLENDEELERLNQEFKDRALNEASSEQEEKAKDLLAELLYEPEVATQGEVKTDGGDGSGGDGGNGGGGSRDPVKPRHNYPTFVEIDNSHDPLRAQQGRTMRVRVKTDAADDYETLDRGEITIGWDDVLDEALTYRSETALSEGWKVFQIEVAEDADVGVSGEIKVAAEWPAGRETDTRAATVVEPVEQSGGGTQRAGLQAPEIRQVYEEQDEVRQTVGLTEDDSVVEYTPDDDGPGEVFVAMFNENIQPIRETNETEGIIERYDRQYAAYIAYFEVMRQQELEENGVEEPAPGYVKREKNRTATMLMRSISEGLNPEELGVV